MQRIRERKEYLDIAKGIGILLVVAGHTNNPFQSIIYQFHVPLFFFISGMLFHGEKPPRQYMIEKVRSLYIPYLVANFVVLPLVACMEGWSFVIIFKKSIKILLLLDKIYLIGASWYLASLLWISIGIYGIYWVIEKQSLFWGKCAELSIVVIGISAMYVYLPYKIDTTLVGASFYVLGKMWIKQGKTILPRKWLFLGLILICAAVVNQVDMATNTYTYPVLFLLSAWVGSGCVLIVSSNLENTKAGRWFSLIGRNTRPILLWHFCWFKLVSFLQILWYHWDMNRIWEFPVCLTGGLWWILYVLVGSGGPLLVSGIKSGIAVFQFKGNKNDIY